MAASLRYTLVLFWNDQTRLASDERRAVAFYFFSNAKNLAKLLMRRSPHKGTPNTDELSKISNIDMHRYILETK